MWQFLAILWFYISTFLVGAWFAFRWMARRPKTPGRIFACFVVAFLASLVWFGLIWYWISLTVMALFATWLIVAAAEQASKR